MMNDSRGLRAAQLPRNGTRLSIRAILRPLAVLIALGAIAWSTRSHEIPDGDLLAARTLQAATQPLLVFDYDGDGIDDAAEEIIGTHNWAADSDHDGFIDSEELARDSDPLDPGSIPLAEAPHAGLDASAHDGSLHLISTFYVRSELIGAYSVQFGAVLAGKLVFLGPRKLGNNVTTRIVPAATAGMVIVVVDLTLRPQLVHRFGALPFVTTLIENGQIVAAEKVDIAVVDGLLMRRFELPSVMLAATAAGASAQQSSSQSGLDPLSFYKSLAGEVQNSNGISGAVCVQQTQTVGAGGGTVTQEVIDAGCQDGWDGFCSSGCAASVGGTYVTVDPGLLIGG